MISSRFRVVGLIAAAAVLATACSSAEATPTTAPTPSPTPTAMASESAMASEMASEAPSAMTLPTIPADQLIKAGTLTVCSDTSYPPQESLDENNKAVGSDIDLITALAAKLGLSVDVKTTNFDTIIPALTGGTCDVIVSAQTITTERQAQVDMIPYFAAGQSFVVLKGNPENIKTQDDLCGKTIAAQTGTIEADYVTGGGSGYDQTNGLSPMCVAAGKAPITLKTYTKDTDALQALQSGIVVAHFTDEPVAGYEVAQSNGAFELSPLTLERGTEGISVTKNHTGLRDAIKAALIAMIDDGSYLDILTKWGVQSGAVTAADVNS
jgi:polar amino acid transport system substrate-binding protein